jgi:hypothetical protein
MISPKYVPYPGAEVRKKNQDPGDNKNWIADQHHRDPCYRYWMLIRDTPYLAISGTSGSSGLGSQSSEQMLKQQQIKA